MIVTLAVAAAWAVGVFAVVTQMGATRTARRAPAPSRQEQER